MQPVQINHLELPFRGGSRIEDCPIATVERRGSVQERSHSILESVGPLRQVVVGARGSAALSLDRWRRMNHFVLMREREPEVLKKWRGLVSEQTQSGQSAAKFCRERGLRVWQF